MACGTNTNPSFNKKDDNKLLTTQDALSIIAPYEVNTHGNVDSDNDKDNDEPITV